MRFSIDLETACTVPSCPHVGRSICANGHSLSPWHSRITVAAVAGKYSQMRQVFRGTSAEIAQKIRHYIEAHDDYEVVGQNFKFDWLHLARHGFEIPMDRWVGDSQLAAYVLTEKIPDRWLAEYEAKRVATGSTSHRKASKHSLKTLAPYFLGVDPFWEPEHDHDDDAYVTKDAVYTLDLVNVLEAKLKERGEFDFYHDMQLPWTKMLLAAEWRGTRIDAAALEQKERELQVRAVELRRKLDTQWSEAHAEYVRNERNTVFARYADMARKAVAKLKDKGKAEATMARYEEMAVGALAKLPEGIEYDSPKQMTWLLRDYLGYNIASLEGGESTGREVLERLAEEGKEDVKTYLEWRKVNKILSAFLPTYKELMVEEGGGFVVHPILNPDATRTGRTSSERPNMQQVPPSLRPLFVARPGYKMIGYDAAAIEAKLIALYTADPTLFAIIDTGISLHDFNTVNYFELDADYSEVKTKYPLQRKAAKNVGFALFYNAGFNRIRIAFAQAGFPIGSEQAKRIHARFKKAFPVATGFVREVVEHMENGNVLTNLLGRPLRIEHAEDAYMKSFNMLIQSSASDLLLHGSLRAAEDFKAAGIDAHPLLFVHDFVCFEVREDQVEQADTMLKHALTDFDLRNTNGRIRLEVDGGVMSRWDK